jgi:hypothetical protein
MSEQEIQNLEASIKSGNFRFGDTARLTLLKKTAALVKAKQLLKEDGTLDSKLLYTYIVSLEKKVEALEELVEMLRRLIV